MRLRRHAAHAPARPRHADVGHLPRRPRRRTSIKIDDWDFGWQNTYYFEKPLDLPKGSVVKVVAHFDNSAEQPPQPEQAAQARQVGRGDHRRDVHRLHRRDQEGPGPDPARREGRPPWTSSSQMDDYRNKRDEAARKRAPARRNEASRGPYPREQDGGSPCESPGALGSGPSSLALARGDLLRWARSRPPDPGRTGPGPPGRVRGRVASWHY